MRMAPWARATALEAGLEAFSVDRIILATGRSFSQKVKKVMSAKLVVRWGFRWPTTDGQSHADCSVGKKDEEFLVLETRRPSTRRCDVSKH